MRFALALAALLPLTLPACGRDAEVAEPSGGEPATPVESAPAEKVPPSPVQTHMREHFQAVRDAIAAVIHNDLRSAHQIAQDISEKTEPPAIATWTDHLSAMRRAAASLQMTRDIGEAAEWAARLGGECAACHESHTAIASFEWHEKPTVVAGDVKSHMAMHKWATDRLWEGLVGPSRAHWLEGAEALAQEPLHPDELQPASTLDPAVATLAKAVHDIAAEGRRAETTEERVAIYGRLLGSCAACHALTRR